MISAITTNYIQKYQAQNTRTDCFPEQKSNSVSFCAAGKLLALPPRLKTSEPLKTMTAWYLQKAADLVDGIANETDTHVKRRFINEIIPDIDKRQTRGILLYCDFQFLVSPVLTNAKFRTAGTPKRSLKVSLHHSMEGQYQVTEGSKVYDIHLPKTRTGGTSGCIKYSKKGDKENKGAKLSVNFNDEVLRIVKALMAEVKQSEVFKTEPKTT